MVVKVHPTILAILALSCSSGGSAGTPGSSQNTGGSSPVGTTTGGSISTGGSSAQAAGGVLATTGGNSGTASGCSSGYTPTKSLESSVTMDNCTQFTSVSPRTVCVGSSSGLSIQAGPCSSTNVFAKCENDNYVSDGVSGILVVFWYNNTAYTLDVVQAACKGVGSTLTVM
jgi:hypothetical protein